MPNPLSEVNSPLWGYQFPTTPPRTGKGRTSNSARVLYWVESQSPKATDPVGKSMQSTRAVKKFPKPSKSFLYFRQHFENTSSPSESKTTNRPSSTKEFEYLESMSTRTLPESIIGSSVTKGQSCLAILGTTGFMYAKLSR